MNTQSNASKCYPIQFSKGITTSQKGVTLFTALIFLIMLTLLGANAAQMSNLEERMSGNTRNRDLAFQAAEAALKHVEQNLNAGENIKSLNFDGSVAGLRTFNACIPNTADYWNGNGALDCGGATQQYTWSDNNSREPSTSIRLNPDDATNATLQPKYIVEKIGASDTYRVTARGLGGDGTSIVILQAMFSYAP